MWWILPALCLVIYVVYMKLVRPHSYWKNKGVPYVKPFPVLGCMSNFIFKRKTILEIMSEMYSSFDTKYFGTYQILYPTLVLKDLDLIKQIAIKDFEHFTDHRVFLPEDTEPLFGKNLIALKGERWKDMRSTLSPAFTSSKMRAMFLLINDCADQFVKYFESKAAELNVPQVVEMKDIYSRYTTDVIGTCAFGVTCDSLQDQENEFYMTGKEAFNFTGLKNLLILINGVVPRLTKLFNIKFFSDRVRSFLRGLIKNTITYREENGVIRPDMIHLLMEARKGRLKHEENEPGDCPDGFASVEESQIGKARATYKAELSDDDIVAQALIFFLAGFETSSTFLTFTAYELALHPEVQAKLQDEIDATLEECRGNLTYEVILKMKYLDMMVSESLRKWPPAIMTDRLCVKPYVLEHPDATRGPLTVEVDDSIWIPIYNIHHDPKYFPNPEQFDPERFSDENKENILPNSFLAFGVGPRNCIGSRFALLEAKTLLVKLLHKFDIVVVEKTQIPLKISKKTFNLMSESGIWLGLQLRGGQHKITKKEMI